LYDAVKCAKKLLEVINFLEFICLANQSYMLGNSKYSIWFFIVLNITLYDSLFFIVLNITAWLLICCVFNSFQQMLQREI
jgi:hypothetical protein